MSFRTNLQYLRAERHMTQEQLAMLLGVSRQSVTKWEAEKSYPEMDKLIKMCQIFECSLDDLVTGDVTDRGISIRGDLADRLSSSVPMAGVAGDATAAPSVGGSYGAPLDAPACAMRASSAVDARVIPDGPVTDVCGYDEHMIVFAQKIALGITLVILGAASAVFADAVMHSDGMILVALFVFVALGMCFIVPAGMDHAAFKKAHPYVADFYTEEQKHLARHHASAAIVAGIALILAGVAISALFDVESSVRAYGNPLMLAFVAFGSGVIIYWGMLWVRMNLERYNKEWFEAIDLSEEELLRLDAKSRDAYVRASDPARRQNAVRSERARTVIMLIATAIALTWLIVAAVFGAPGASGYFFWLPWAIAGVLAFL